MPRAVFKVPLTAQRARYFSARDFHANSCSQHLTDSAEVKVFLDEKFPCQRPFSMSLTAQRARYFRTKISMPRVIVFNVSLTASLPPHHSPSPPLILPIPLSFPCPLCCPSPLSSTPSVLLRPDDEEPSLGRGADRPDQAAQHPGQRQPAERRRYARVQPDHLGQV